MSYNVGQLYDRFHDSLHTQRAVSVSDVRHWIEEAQTEIARFFGQVNIQLIPATGTVTPNLPVSLATDCLGVAEVRAVGGDYRPYQNYMVTPYDQILFIDSGQYNVFYFKVPDPLVDTASGGETDSGIRALTLEVHDMFHLTIIDYLLYRYWEKNSEAEAGEANYATNYRQKFMDEVTRTATILRNRSNLTTKTQVRR